MSIDDFAATGGSTAIPKRADRRATTRVGRRLGGLLVVALALAEGPLPPARAQDDVLGQMDRQVAAIVERVKPSVVSVRSGSRRNPGPDKSKPKQSKNAWDYTPDLLAADPSPVLAEPELTGTTLDLLGADSPEILFDPTARQIEVFPMCEDDDRLALFTADDPATSSLFQFENPGQPAIVGFAPSRVGTGFVVDRSGVILTTADVVAASDQVVVRLSDGRELDGKVLGRDATTGIAAVKVEGVELPALKLASEARVGPGQWTIIVGNQLDRPHSVWVGSVARDDVTLTGPLQGKLLQIHAPVGAGASGAPVLNSRGEVVGVVVATANAPWRFGWGADAGWQNAMSGWQNAMTGWQSAMTALGQGDPEWQKNINKLVEEATKKAQEAAARAEKLRQEHEKKSEALKDDPKGLEAEQERFEEELERLEEDVEREVEQITDRFDEDFEKSIEKSLDIEGFEKAIEAHVERIVAEAERQAEAGASAEEIQRLVQKSLQDARLHEQIQRIVEEARRISEEAALKVRALQEQRQKSEAEQRKAIEKAKKQGRAGEADRRRAEQALRRDQQRLMREQQRLQMELRRRQQILQGQVERLNAALPKAPGVRSITVDLSPKLAKIAEPARARVRVALETAFTPPVIELPAIPAPAAGARPPRPHPSPNVTAVAPVPQPAPSRIAMAAPEVRFWSGRTPGEAGVTYAVPIERVRWALDQIREHGRVRHAYLGVKFEVLSDEDRARLKAPEGSAVRVAEVVKGSPAEEAGLRADDVILEFDGRKLSDAAELGSQMARAKVGVRVSLSVWRGGERQSVTATLRERPQPANKIQAWGLGPGLGAAPFVFAPNNQLGNSLRTFVKVGPSGHVAASAAGTGRQAKITLDARDAELESVLKELSRATSMQFGADTAVAKKRVTVKVENVSVDDLVESLNRLYGLRADRDGSKVTFRAK